MITYDKNCYKCHIIQTKHFGYDEIESDEFYRGFFIRKHYVSRLALTTYSLCVRFAEGGDDELLDLLSGYVNPFLKSGMFRANTCRCHPHQVVAGVNDTKSGIWAEVELVMKRSIDMLYGESNAVRDMQQE